MTYRQKLLKAAYPVFLWLSKKLGARTASKSGHAHPAVSFYTLNSTLNDGTAFDFSQLKNRKVLIVNTASDCGYTGQYRELQQLAERYKSRLTVIAFPANDFKQQEKGTDQEIASFCELNYGVRFPLMKKTTVIKVAGQHPVYQWLTNSKANGWNDQAPTWNFCKYLIDEQGELIHFFESGVSPVNAALTKAIES